MNEKISRNAVSVANLSFILEEQKQNKQEDTNESQLNENSAKLATIEVQLQGTLIYRPLTFRQIRFDQKMYNNK